MKIKLFLAHAKKEQSFCTSLEHHLRELQKKEFYGGSIGSWSFASLPAKEWDDNTLDDLDNANIVLLLMSPDFLKDDSFQSAHLENLLIRHDERRAMALPLIVPAMQLGGDRPKPFTSHSERRRAAFRGWNGLEKRVRVIDGRLAGCDTVFFR